MENNQLNELFHHLQLIEKSKDEDVFSSMVDHITTLLRAVDNASLRPIDRNFLLARHLIHYLLVQNYIEPIEVTEHNSVPSSIADKKCNVVPYRVKVLNFDVKLWIERIPNGFLFILVSAEKNSNTIFVKYNDIKSFLGNDNICVKRRNEAVKSFNSIIQAYLRGKSSESSALESPDLANPDEIVTLNKHLYFVS